MTSLICALCASSVPKNPIMDDVQAFCCGGCHAVYKILSSKNALKNYSSHPVFLQAIKSGLISNPLLLEKINNKITDVTLENHKLCLEIGEMWCPSCAELISLILMNEQGVTKCIVDYSTDLGIIHYQPQVISKEKILSLIESCGYLPKGLEIPEARKTHSSLSLRFLVAAFCAFNIMMFSYPVYAAYFDFDESGYGDLFGWLSLITSLPVLTYSAWPIYKRFFLTLKWGLLGMETLVTLSILAAFSLSLYGLMQGSQLIYFDTLSVIITLVLLGKMIETKAKFSAKDSILWLTRSLPKRARKRSQDGSQDFVPITDFVPNDIMVVSAGEKICLDGEIIDGEGTCNEAVVTGEAMPVTKNQHDSVISGSLLMSGWLLIRVTTTSKDSALHKLFEMVEQQISDKVQYRGLADRISAWFVPFLCLLALSVGLGIYWFEGTIESSLVRSISILLIACPCAIGIAAPLAESHLINKLASLGVIVKNRGCLSLLGHESIFVFDKTGTVTLGKYKILEGLDELTELQKRILKGMALLSLHPISVALKEAISESPIMPDKVEIITGKGLKSWLNNEIYFLGSSKFLEQNGLIVPEEITNTSIVTQVYFGHHKFMNSIILGDTLRNGVVELLKELDTPYVLLSGDSRAAVESVSKASGFEEFYWGMSPKEKKTHVENYRKEGKIVCMVGDGMNDAPALASAQIGISMWNASDISMHASDILLTTENFEVINQMRKVALKGQRIVKQNMFWAFLYNLIGIPLAVFGFLSPIFAAFAMVTSSIFVLFNSQRLK